MIPVRSLEGGRIPDLTNMVSAEVELVERGLTVVASCVPLLDDLVVDVLAEDPDGRVVLILTEDGPADPLFERAARVVVAYRRTAPLLLRLYPNAAIDSRDSPRLILLARRFSDQAEDLLSVLRIPSLRFMECAVVNEAGGDYLVITSRGEARPSAHRSPMVRITDREREESAVELSSGRTGRTDRKAVGGRAARRGAGRDEQIVPAARRSKQVDNGRRASTGNSTESYLDEIKQRLLRLSPEVEEEEDGDLFCFRISGHLLASVCRDDAGVLLTPGGPEEDEAEEEPIRVDDPESLTRAMDAVFDCFFGLAPSRERLEAADRRQTRHQGGRRPRTGSREERG